MNTNTTYITLTDTNFQKQVLMSKQPVLVEFWADWSGPCHIVAPIVEELTNELNGKIKLGGLDIDRNKSVAQEYGIRNLPTFLFFKNGQIVDHIFGAVPKKVLIVKLNGMLQKGQ